MDDYIQNLKRQAQQILQEIERLEAEQERLNLRKAALSRLMRASIPSPDVLSALTQAEQRATIGPPQGGTQMERLHRYLLQKPDRKATMNELLEALGKPTDIKSRNALATSLHREIKLGRRFKKAGKGIFQAVEK